MGLLEGKVAVITGAGGGIGRGHALLFAQEGARVVVNDLGGTRAGSGTDACTAQQVADEIIAAGGDAVPNFDDISDTAGANNLIQTALTHYGKLDILVNNAGILRDKTLLKMTDEMWDEVIKVHLRGTFLCTRAAAAHMRERGEGGRIINTSSVSGLIGNFGQGNYGAAKAGIYGFTRSVAQELRKFNITVNALAPVAHTRMTEDLPHFKAMTEAGTILGADAIAPGALFLASDAAANITGEVLAVEGPKVFLYKMLKTDAVQTESKDGVWSAAEIQQRWTEITGSN